MGNEPGQHKAKSPMIGGATYDALKNAAMIAIPGLGALYFTIAQFWGLPKAEEVVGTAAALATFLGLFVRSQKKRYDNSDDKYDAVVNVQEGEFNKNYEFDFGEKDVADVVDPKKEILLKVRHVPPPVAPEAELPLQPPEVEGQT